MVRTTLFMGPLLALICRLEIGPRDQPSNTRIRVGPGHTSTTRTYVTQPARWIVIDTQGFKFANQSSLVQCSSYASCWFRLRMSRCQANPFRHRRHTPGINDEQQVPARRRGVPPDVVVRRSLHLDCRSPTPDDLAADEALRLVEA